MTDTVSWLITPASITVPHPATLILAHGAGAPMDSPFLADIAQRFAAIGLTVARFEFPYMQARRQDGRRRPPPAQAKLTAYFADAIDDFRQNHPQAAKTLLIGGKSMGGRMASLIADDSAIQGLIVLGFPFHAPGRPEQAEKRIAHLAQLKTPTLIIQGSRDPFGTEQDVAAYSLSEAISVHWCPDGDHDLKPRRVSGYSHDDNLNAVTDEVAAFCRNLQH